MAQEESIAVLVLHVIARLIRNFEFEALTLLVVFLIYWGVREITAPERYGFIFHPQ